MQLRAGDKTFSLNGKEFFLHSGEIHYFRIDPQYWPKHLKALKDAGGNATSTYICWDWHEYEPGKFDFTGKTHPRRNIIGYLELCKKLGLYCIVKPGPYILAEYDGNGIPKRMLEEQKEILAVNEQGQIIATDIISLMNDQYLSETYRWYDQIMPIIKKYQASEGGPIAAMQVCNEVGLQHWLAAQADCSPVVLKMFSQFLKDRFGAISKYNQLSGEKFSDFAQVQPPSGDVRDLKHFAAYYQWHDFWRHYFYVYLKTLTQKIKGYGIDVQLTHNVAGWIFGGASEVPMVLTFYKEVFEKLPEITFGLDHIPEYLSFRNAHCDLALNQMLTAMQGRGPVWSAEFQAGTREHHVRNYAKEMEVFYIGSLAHDMAGWNYYMFSQGDNPPGRGVFSRAFYYQTPLDNHGAKSDLYDVVVRMGKLLKRSGPELLKTEVKAEIGVGVYQPYYYTELITSQIMGRKKLDAGKIGLQYDPRFLREAAVFDGLLRCLQAENLSYRIVDLERASAEEMAAFKQFYVVSADYMDEDTQRKLARMAELGGRLILSPCLPRLDLEMNPSSALKSALGVQTSKKHSSNKISILDIDELFTMSGDKELYQAPGAEVIARTAAGDACGVELKVGKGKVMLIGAAIGYNSNEQPKLFDRLAKRAGVRRDVEISDSEVNAVLRRGQGYGYLFLLNAHPQDKKVKVLVPKDVLKSMGCKKAAVFNVRLSATSAKVFKLS